MTVAAFLLALGATARLTRLITADYLTRGIRFWAVRRWGPDHDIPYLLTCAWCSGLWIAGAVCTIAWFYGHTAPYLIATSALTVSWLYATIAGWVDPTEGALVAALEEEEQ